MHVKPKRRLQTNRKQFLDSKWKVGTWVGMISRSNEHIVIIPDGGLGFAGQNREEKDGIRTPLSTSMRR